MDEQLKRAIAERTWDVLGNRVFFIWEHYPVVCYYDSDRNFFQILSKLEIETLSEIDEWLNRKTQELLRYPEEGEEDDGEKDVSDQENRD